jgi:hypothetical protein
VNKGEKEKSSQTFLNKQIPLFPPLQNGDERGIFLDLALGF